MPIYELINPSDPYTFEAPNIAVAGVVACTLSSGFGARLMSDDVDESSPMLFGWDEWQKEQGIDDAWMLSHRSEVADAFDSFLIGDANQRQDVESMLAELPEEKREAWRAKRQDRHRSSMNQIGERAYQLAQQLRDDPCGIDKEDPNA